jgi:hypothetical protein
MSRDSLIGVLPRRLIAVGGDDNTGIHLVELGKQTVNNPVSYICLSHCWGKVQPLKTERENLKKWKKNIPWQLLPRTFQDAIKITRYLGFSYLWIDSLTIIQDSVEDWEMEAANMGSIYHSASLVIAATGSANSEGGFFFERPGFSVIHGTDVHGSNFTVYSRGFLSHDTFMGKSIGEVPSEVDKDAYPLLTRAWVVQEQILGRFILHFGRDELVFQCLSGTSCECGALKNISMDPLLPVRQFLACPLPEGPDLHGINDIETTNSTFWRNLILNYCQKSITYDTDRLPALAGIASKWPTFTSRKYLAGLWAKDIVRDLMWMNSMNDERSSVAYLAPSWSWVSPGRSCDWITDYNGGRYHVRIDLDKTDCIVKGLNPYGEVQMGWLHITGPVLRGKYDTDRETQGDETLVLRYFTQVTDDKSGFGMDFRLFLEKVIDSELVRYPDFVRTHENVFKRVGCSWGYPDRDSYDERAFMEIEMYLI